MIYIAGTRVTRNEYVLTKVILGTGVVRYDELHDLTGRSSTTLRIVNKSKDFAEYQKLVHEERIPSRKKLAQELRELKREMSEQKKRKRFWLF